MSDSQNVTSNVIISPEGFFLNYYFCKVSGKVLPIAGKKFCNSFLQTSCESNSESEHAYFRENTQETGSLSFPAIFHSVSPAKQKQKVAVTQVNR